MKPVLALTLMICSAASAGTLTVEIQNRKSQTSRVMCSLYLHSDGFPMDNSKSEKFIDAENADGKTICEFKDVSADDVAVSVLEDLNGNGKMDTSSMGIPKEPWGVSKNVPARKFGPPKFSDAKIHLTGDIKIEIKLNR